MTTFQKYSAGSFPVISMSKIPYSNFSLPWSWQFKSYTFDFLIFRWDLIFNLSIKFIVKIISKMYVRRQLRTIFLVFRLRWIISILWHMIFMVAGRAHWGITLRKVKWLLERNSNSLSWENN